jgi:hypothetical protein
MKAQRSLFEPNPYADFSKCEQHSGSCSEACLGRRYRYLLAWPTGLNDQIGFVRDDLRYALFVLANPSTATAAETDPTVARCIAYAKRWGYAWCRVVNVRAWRETNPKLVPEDPRAVSELSEPALNDDTIQAQAMGAGIVVCGWGKLGKARGAQVLAYLRAAGVVPHALKLNQDGTPAHPLYQLADAKPFPIPR